MNFVPSWFLRMRHFCSECFNCFDDHNPNDDQPSSTNRYVHLHEIVKHCTHTSNKIDSICFSCFIALFGSDRFIIRHLFFYLTQDQSQKNDIHLRKLICFTERIINWHELLNSTDFLAQLFHILITTSEYEFQSTHNETSEKNFDEFLPENSILETERRDTTPSLTNLLKQYDPLETITLNYTFLCELIKDAFFFTALQANVSTILTSDSQVFLQRFFAYLFQSNPTHDSKTYLKLIKRILPWAFVSIHRWFKQCLNSPIHQSRVSISENFDAYLPLTFLWYITNWLVSNGAFPDGHDPITIFEKVCHRECIRSIYDSDKHGYSIVILCELIYPINGPFLMMFYCGDDRTFAILLEGNLMDSTKPYGGRSSLCLQLSPQFLILERGPELLYWNVKHRSDGPLAIRIGHNGIIRVSFDLNLEHVHHPNGTSPISRVKIFKFGTHIEPISLSDIPRSSLTHRRHTDLLSIDAHRLAESIGIHLFTS